MGLMAVDPGTYKEMLTFLHHIIILIMWPALLVYEKNDFSGQTY